MSLTFDPLTCDLAGAGAVQKCSAVSPGDWDVISAKARDSKYDIARPSDLSVLGL